MCNCLPLNWAKTFYFLEIKEAVAAPVINDPKIVSTLLLEIMPNAVFASPASKGVAISQLERRDCFTPFAMTFQGTLLWDPSYCYSCKLWQADYEAVSQIISEMQHGINT
jgi:hypothetical protein